MVVFFMGALNRKSGGPSSILDLANMLIEIGEDVTIYTIFGKLDLYIYKPKNVNKKIKIFPMWQECLESYTNKKKKVINRVLNNTYRTKIPSNSIVIDAFRLPKSVINKLKERKNILILNHAGSPNAFIKYFGMNGKVRDNYEEALKEYKDLIKRYDYYWFQSPSQAEKLIDIMEFRKNRTIVLTPGIDERLIEGVKKIKEFEGDFNIVVVGSVHQRKGQHYIPEILRYIDNKIPNIKFHVVGPIVDKEYYSKIKDKKILFYDYRKDYLDFINSADVILQLSEEEGISRILREAMYLEKAIISFKLDGTKDLLVDNEDAILVEYGDVKSISEAILKLYTQKELRDNLSKRARDNYIKKYSSNIYKKRLKSIIKDINESILH